VWVDIGCLADFPEGRATVITVDRRALGLIRWHDKVFALRSVCPHQSGPLCEGPVRPYLDADLPSSNVAIDDDRPVIACPWHGWEFDVQTGRLVTGGPERVRTFPVEIREERVLLNFASGK
jgi:nitrite reductase/ring-hydroxylating ferredoxin subunit